MPTAVPRKDLELIKAIQTAFTALLATSSFALLPATAWADVKAGVDAWAAGNYEAAVSEWRAPAAAGDPDAQFNFAQAYKLGRGVKRDLTKAEELYASAAAKGHLQAGENYGLLLFQRGERVRAMPYIRAGADRGDPRAQYILGLALFNGDEVNQDWVRGYAYVSLAQQAGLPQATTALQQMDQQISLVDRQKSVAVATRIAADANAARARQVATSDLSTSTSSGRLADGSLDLPTGSILKPSTTTPKRPTTPITPITIANNSSTAPRLLSSSSTPVRAQSPARTPSAPRDNAAQRPKVVSPAPRSPVASPKRPVRPPATLSTNGPWRLQLGAFGVPGNAEALWTRVKGRPELAGRRKVLTPSGKLTRLLVAGYASQADANAACAKLKSGGFTCLATRN